MSDWVFLNKHRQLGGIYGSLPMDGFNGRFFLPIPGEARRVWCVASDGKFSGPYAQAIAALPKWQHVSVSFGPDAKSCPSWKLMCQIKDLFWEPEDAVIQIHPPRSQYINFHPFCLHLWRALDEKQPLPPAIFVGPASRA